MSCTIGRLLLTSEKCSGFTVALISLTQDAKGFAKLNQDESFEEWRQILNLSSLSLQRLLPQEIVGWSICKSHMTPAKSSKTSVRKDQCSICSKFHKSGVRTVSCFTSPSISKSVGCIVPIGSTVCLSCRFKHREKVVDNERHLSVTINKLSEKTSNTHIERANGDTPVKRSIANLDEILSINPRKRLCLSSPEKDPKKVISTSSLRLVKSI